MSGQVSDTVLAEPKVTRIAIREGSAKPWKRHAAASKAAPSATESVAPSIVVIAIER